MAVKTEMNFWEKTKLFCNQVKTEMQKVSWPSKDDVRTYTIVVLVSSAIVSLLIGGWDWLLAKGLELILQLTGA